MIKYGLILESHHFYTMIFYQISSSPFIIRNPFGSEMMMPIQLHAKPDFRAIEVHDERSDRKLPSEQRPFNLSVL